MYTLRFTYSFSNPGAVEKKPAKWSDETMIYLPRRRYEALLAGSQVHITVTDGSFVYNPEVCSLSSS
jgi:hypothetical protein